jgi:energy-coupling factor transporter ATP-binding protein EcfA2
MIEKVRIRNYRKLKDVTFVPNAGLNVVVGDNGSGKSTLLEAVSLALTGRINGRSAQEELNPFWFNETVVREFFEKRARGGAEAPPTLSIELFLSDLDEYQRLVGAHNSDGPARHCPGLGVHVEPNPEHYDDLEQFLREGGTILPTDFYRVAWRDFADNELTSRPKVLKTAVIDSRTLRSTTSIDFHLRQILSDHLGADERAKISAAYTHLKDQLTRSELGTVNVELAKLGGTLDGQPLRLGMDQTSKASWDASVVPYVSTIPFGMVGQGQQAAVKIGLAMARHADATRFVMVEEPENHLSHTNLNKLLRRFEERGEGQQIFIATHSSFVLNRLGLSTLTFLCDGKVSDLGSISEETVRYFQKLPGYDTLRMVLADRFVMVEGPSDEILFEKFYRDRHSRRPIEDGIDVVSMRGLSFKRGLELAKALGKRCAVVRDNDGESVASLLDGLAALLTDGERQAFIGDQEKGTTLEPQVHAANEEAVLRAALKLKEKQDVLTWMLGNKTECAIRLAESDARLSAPPYIEAAIVFIHDAQQ